MEQEASAVGSLLLFQDHSAGGSSGSKEGTTGPGQGGGSAPSLRAEPCSWAASEKRAADRGPPAGAEVLVGGGATSSLLSRTQRRPGGDGLLIPTSSLLFRSFYGTGVSTLSSFLSSDVDDALGGGYTQSSVISLDSTLQKNHSIPHPTFASPQNTTSDIETQAATRLGDLFPLTSRGEIHGNSDTIRLNYAIKVVR